MTRKSWTRGLALAVGLASALMAAAPAYAAVWVPGHYGPYGRWIPGHWGPGPFVVVRPPVVVAPPVVVVPRRVWVPAHWAGGVWVPGHWAR